MFKCSTCTHEIPYGVIKFEDKIVCKSCISFYIKRPDCMFSTKENPCCWPPNFETIGAAYPDSVILEHFCGGLDIPRPCKTCAEFERLTWYDLVYICDKHHDKIPELIEEGNLKRGLDKDYRYR